ncbi:uncharacterized protein LOC135932390 [Pelmatolapia mariae]|uniref:uncharacterized protein LOC135932390 n=1 Tax=Pelmatolapia mariae TaxID=158779 RepID=UPI003211D6BD
MGGSESKQEGVPPSKSTLCGEHESQTKAQRNPPGPPPSSVSNESNSVKDVIKKFEQRQSAEKRIHQRLKPGPPPSSVSLQSDRSKEAGIFFKSGVCRPAERVDQQSSEVPSGQSAQQHQTQLDSIFMLLEDNIITFVKNELKKIQKVLSPDYPECLESQRSSSREAFVKITVDFLRRMKQEELADRLQRQLQAAVCRRNLKSALKKKFQCVFEGIAKAGNPTLLNQIYTELYITEGGTAEVNDEHEVRQIETASRKPDRPETTIRQEDIFKASPGGDEPIRTEFLAALHVHLTFINSGLNLLEKEQIPRLSHCDLSERSCEALALGLSSQTSNLRQLDLSNSNLKDSGVKLLSVGLKSPHCTLETLR